jgi:hypothetical protein
MSEYPKRLGATDMYWACCVSIIGPPCQHTAHNPLWRKVLELLRTDNPNEASGEWSIFDLTETLWSEAYPIGSDMVISSIEALQSADLCSSGRYVGGTTGSLYFAPSNGGTMSQWNDDAHTMASHTNCALCASGVADAHHAEPFTDKD